MNEDLTYKDEIEAQAHDQYISRHSLTKEEVDALLTDCDVISKTADKIIESDILQEILDRR